MNSLETSEGISEIVRDLFRYANVSNRQVAKLMHCDEKTVRNWVEGYSEPKPSTMVRLFRVLSVPMLPFILSRSDGTAVSDDRAVISDYVENYASDSELRDMRFNLTSKHGSSVPSQQALVSMLNHMTLRYRLLVAKLALNLWEIAESEGSLQYQDDSMPDINKVRQAVIKSHNALKDGKNSYTDI